MNHQLLVDELNEAMAMSDHPLDPKAVDRFRKYARAVDALDESGASWAYVVTPDGLRAALFDSHEEAGVQRRLIWEAMKAAN